MNVIRAGVCFSCSCWMLFACFICSCRAVLMHMLTFMLMLMLPCPPPHRESLNALDAYSSTHDIPRVSDRV